MFNYAFEQGKHRCFRLDEYYGFLKTVSKNILLNPGESFADSQRKMESIW